MIRVRTLAIGLATFVAWATPALAVDGVIEINQAAVFAGGITPGDTPGFPVTLSEKGSYRLTGNLDVTKRQDGSPQPSPENVTAISTTVSEVTIDLNGFAISGPVICGGFPLTCSPLGGTGSGVTSGFDTAVVNGTIRGMGRSGVVLTNGGLVEAVRAVSNAAGGILASTGTIKGCFAQSNGASGIEGVGTVVTNNNSLRNVGSGIVVVESSVVIGNASNGNGIDGINASGSVVQSNAATGNTMFGLRGDSNTGWGTNVFNANNSGGPQTSGVTIANQIPPGSNICGSDTTCP